MQRQVMLSMHAQGTSVVVYPVVPSCSLPQHAGATRHAGCPPAKAAGVSHTRAGSQAHSTLLPPSCKHWGPGSPAFECTTAPQPHCRMPTALAAPAAATHTLLAQLQQRAVLCSTKVHLAPPSQTTHTRCRVGGNARPDAHAPQPGSKTLHTPPQNSSKQPASTAAICAQPSRKPRPSYEDKEPRQLQVQGNNMPRPQQPQGRRQHPRAAACRPHKQTAT